MASVQTTILKCVLLDKGLTDGQAEDIGLLLLEEPENMQQAFYYRGLGLKHKEIAELIGCSRVHVGRLIKKCRKLYQRGTLC